MWLPKKTQVVSLHGAAPALAACVAASFGGALAVYDTAAVKPGEVAKAKAVWPAHASHITALHRSAHAPALFSGAHDGSIHQCAPILASPTAAAPVPALATACQTGGSLSMTCSSLYGQATCVRTLLACSFPPQQDFWWPGSRAARVCVFSGGT